MNTDQVVRRISFTKIFQNKARNCKLTWRHLDFPANIFTEKTAAEMYE